MSEYELKELVNLIDKLRPLNNKQEWLINYLRLQALFTYFQYTVASVRLQEENINKMAGGQHKNFKTHEEYEDCLLKLYSCTVTAYSNLRVCLNFSYEIIKDIPESKQSAELKKFRNDSLKWAKEVIDKRDRVASHPEEKDRIVWSPDMWCDDGRVGFRAINPQNPTSSRKIILEPRKDLEILRKYLSRLFLYLAKSWEL